MAHATRKASNLNSRWAPCVNKLTKKLLDLDLAKGDTQVEKDNYIGIPSLGLKLRRSGGAGKRNGNSLLPDIRPEVPKPGIDADEWLISEAGFGCELATLLYSFTNTIGKYEFALGRKERKSSYFRKSQVHTRYYPILGM